MIWVKILVFLSPYILFFIGMAISCYIGYRDLDVVLGIFKKSWGVLYYGRMQEGNWTLRTRTFLASNLSGTLAWPGRNLRKGMLEPDELAQLPLPIQARMRWAAGFTLAGYIGLFISCGVFLLLE